MKEVFVISGGAQCIHQAKNYRRPVDVIVMSEKDYFGTYKPGVVSCWTFTQIWFFDREDLETEIRNIYPDAIIRVTSSVPE